LSACPILLCRKETAVLVVEKAIMKMQKKTQRHTKGLTTQFIDFLYALEYELHAGMIFTTVAARRWRHMQINGHR